MTRQQYFVALLVMMVSGLVGGGLATWLLPGRAAYAQADGVAKEVRAERFALVDGEGRGRAALEMLRTDEPDRDGPALRLFDGKGKPRVMLHLEYDEPSLELLDRAGNVRATLCLAFDDHGEGSPELWLHDRPGPWSGGILLTTWGGEPELRLFGIGGLRAWLGVSDGNAGLELHGPAGSLSSAGVRVHRDTGPGILLSDAPKQPRVVLGATETEHTITGAVTRHPVSTITLFDDTGRLTWQAP